MKEGTRVRCIGNGRFRFGKLGVIAWTGKSKEKQSWVLFDGELYPVLIEVESLEEVQG